MSLPGPVRVQLSRKKGWKMPPNTVRVSRPTFYGNPFKIGCHYKRGGGAVPRLGIQWTFVQAFEGYQDDSYTTISDAIEAVSWYQWYVTTWSPIHIQEARQKLGGKNLACWCPLDQPCHADVLLELANRDLTAAAQRGE